MIESTINEARTMRDEVESDDQCLRPGDEILGRYVVQSKIGGGGMGVVYQCLDRIGGVVVAVKGLRPEVSHNADEMEKVRSNYSLVQGLHHPNICGVKTLEKDARGDYYLVMDLVQGMSLTYWMNKHHNATDAERLEILRQIAAALDYAHARKIIHRDVKPENVMVAEDGMVQVLDFGIAAQVSSNPNGTSQAVTSRSGTPSYKAPEQWAGQRQGPATDQYALGVIAYKMFAGYLPFEVDNHDILKREVLNAPVPNIRSASSAVNVAFAKVLAKKPGGRFRSCKAFVDALEVKAVSPKRKRFAVSPKVLGVAAAIVLVGIGWRWLGRVGQTAAAPTASRQSSTAAAEEWQQLEKRAEVSAFDLATQMDNEAQIIAGESEEVRMFFKPEILAFEKARKSGNAANAVNRHVTATNFFRQAKSHANALKRLIAERSTCLAAKARAEAAKEVVDGKAANAAIGADYIEAQQKLNEVSSLMAARNFDKASKLADEARVQFDALKEEAERLVRFVVTAGTRAGELKTFTLPGGETMEMVWCPPGSFTMGSPASEDRRDSDEEMHRVTLTQGFWLGRYEVTQRQWKSVMGSNPSRFKGDDLPVESVSWEDCQKFIARCNHVAEGGAFALPTEAQWEYACRAETTGPYAGTGVMDEMGWCKANSGSMTHPVGQKQPNAWGLYDMHGNVWEWCEDRYGGYKGDEIDPTGATSVGNCVERGGSWSSLEVLCRSALRLGDKPNIRSDILGFRLRCSAGSGR